MESAVTGKKNNQRALSLKPLFFWPRFRGFLFYRSFFSFSNLLRGCLAYFFYIISAPGAPIRPISINFLITSACNFRCGMCSFGRNKNSGSEELTEGDIEGFVHTRLGYKPAIFFSGGEPFARKDFIGILKAVKGHKLKCGINTNGYLIDKDIIKKLLNLEIDLIIFSLYGPEEVHDAITGMKGSYAKIIENVSLLCRNRSRKTKIILSCALTKQNLDFLEELPLIAKKLGVEAVKFEHLNFLSKTELEKDSEYFGKEQNRANTFITDWENTPGISVERLIEKLTKIKTKYRDFVFIKPDLNNEEIRKWYSDDFHSKRKCFFVWHSFFVRPDGVIVPCQFLLDYKLGNIKEDRICDIFRSDKMLRLRKILKKQLLPECRRCCKL